MQRLSGKIALITGGSSGIGLATAKLFVAEGALVIITGRRERELNAAVAELGEAASGVQVDAGELADLNGLFAQIKAIHGRLDIVFANAGVGQFVPLGNITEEHFDRTFDVNVKGTLFMVQEALRLMPRRRIDRLECVDCLNKRTAGIQCLFGFESRGAILCAGLGRRFEGTEHPSKRYQSRNGANTGIRQTRTVAGANEGLSGLAERCHSIRKARLSRGNRQGGAFFGVRRKQLRQWDRAFCGRWNFSDLKQRSEMILHIFDRSDDGYAKGEAVMKRIGYMLVAVMSR